MATLIERLNERANDPKHATDDGHGSLDAKGRPVIYVATAPATEEQIAAAEKRLGFRLPDLLRQVYLEVGNGGFGPHYGLRGLPTSEQGAEESVVTQYLMLRQIQTSPPWPTGLIPICEWGYGISSFLDCTRSEAPVLRLDPNMPKADVAERVPIALHYDRADQVGEACWLESPSLQVWMESWVDGKKLFYTAYGEVGEQDDDDADEDEE